MTYQINLTHILRERFEKNRQSRDLKLAIKLSRNAVNLTSVENEHRTFRLCCLAHVLHTKYEIIDSLKHLKDAIESNKLAIECSSKGNEDRNSAYAKFSQLLQLKFAILESMKDLNSAIEAGEIVVHVGLDGKSEASHLHDLASAYQRRYDWLDSTNSLEKVIELYEKALSSSIDSIVKNFVYSNQSSALEKRFERFERSKNLTESVKAAKNFIQLVNRTTSLELFLINLGFRLHTKDKSIQDMKDLNEAMKTYERALALNVTQYLREGSIYNDMRSVFRTRYEISHFIEDLKQMIAVYKKALNKTSKEHSFRTLQRNNLDQTHASLFQHTQSSRN